MNLAQWLALLFVVVALVFLALNGLGWFLEKIYDFERRED